jgi:flagellar basal-body rod protein FlgC
MSLERAFEISASGLTAQRTRMETVASNLANSKVTRTAEGGPYRRRHPVFVAETAAVAFGDQLGGALRRVRVERIVEDTSPPILRHEPGHPDADERGFVAYPNVDPVREMVDMLSATRSYEANVTTISSIRSMLRAALEIVR